MYFGSCKKENLNFFENYFLRKHDTMPLAHRVADLECAGVGTLGTGVDEQTQIADGDATLHSFIPAEGLSALLVSDHRILVTGGVTGDERVLPLTVLRYLDLDDTGAHTWAQPVALRGDVASGGVGAVSQAPSQRRRRRRADGTYPVSRKAHTLTGTPGGQLYLVGGLKVGGRDEGHPCKSMFALDIAREQWVTVEVAQATSKSKSERENFIGPRFAHIAAFHNKAASARSARSRSRAGAGSIVVHGGYAAVDDRTPLSAVHAYDLRTQRWALVPSQCGHAPARAFHAAALFGDRYLVLHGGNSAGHKDVLVMSDETHVFDLQNATWTKPALHGDSLLAPSARRMHSAVNGIGSHEGAVVFYGGQQEDGGFSDSLYSLRLIIKGNQISCLWRKHLVAQHPPSHSDVSLAVAVAAIVACPAVQQYFIIGGRGPHGVRRLPFTLAATETEEEDMEHTSTPHARRESIPLRLPRRSRTSTNTEPTSVHRSDADSRTVHPIAEPETRKNPGRAESGAPVNEPADPMTPDDEVVVKKTKSKKKTKSCLKRPRKTPTIVLTPTPPSSVPDSSIENVDFSAPLTKEKEDARAGVNEASAMDEATTARPASPNDAAKSMENNATNDVLPVRENEDIGVHTPVAKRKRLALREKLGADGTAVIDVDAMEITGADETPAPPEKPATMDCDVADADNMSDDDDDSGFMTSAALANRGREIARARNRARGRGGGRGRGRGRSRALVEAEVEREKMNIEQEKKMYELTTKNKQLARELDTQIEDNRNLNMQIGGLLKEVKELRNMRDESEKQKSSDPASAIERKAQSALNWQQDSEISSLKSRNEDLKEEIGELNSEKEKLVSEFRVLETQLKAAKMLAEMEKTKADEVKQHCNILMSKMGSFKEAALESKSLAEAFCSENSQLRAKNVSLERHIMHIRREKSATGSELQDGQAELSNAKRSIATLKAQLLETEQNLARVRNREVLLSSNVKDKEEQIRLAESDVNKHRAEKELLDDKCVRANAELKSAQKNLLVKISECELAQAELKRLQSVTTESRREVADKALEQSRAVKECERLKVQVLRLEKEREERARKVAMFLPNILREVQSISSVFNTGNASMIADMSAEIGGAVVSNGIVKEGTNGKENSAAADVEAKEASNVEKDGSVDVGNATPSKSQDAKVILVPNSEETEGTEEAEATPKKPSPRKNGLKKERAAGVDSLVSCDDGTQGTQGTDDAYADEKGREP